MIRCGAKTSGAIISWGSPMVIFKSTYVTYDFTNLSVREISHTNKRLEHTTCMVIILGYQCNNGISRFDGTFVSMLEMGYRDARESVLNSLIHTQHQCPSIYDSFFSHTTVITC